MKKETSCINSKVILAYVKEHNYGDCAELLENLDPEIDALPDPESFLTDPNNWISSTVASKLYERARLILNDEMTAYKIGKYGKPNREYWVGSGHARKLKEYVEIMASLYPSEEKLQFGKMPYNDISLTKEDFSTELLYQDTGFMPNQEEESKTDENNKKKLSTSSSSRCSNSWFKSGTVNAAWRKSSSLFGRKQLLSSIRLKKLMQL